MSLQVQFGNTSKEQTYLASLVLNKKKTATSSLLILQELGGE
ncbi:ASCH domain-containing protein [Vagococcus acidifermentans]|nr:hypothetical protein [Vagococcus acidifermentans]